MPHPNPVLTLVALCGLLGGLLGACGAPPAAPSPAPATPAPAAPAPAAPAPPPPPPPTRAPLFTLESTPDDGETARALEAPLSRSVARIEGYFGRPFPRGFAVVVHPDRASFDASFPPEWGLARTECWMVATGVGDGVALLSPRAWRAEACEHEAEDARHVEQLLAHELVHTFHGQHNPSPDFVDVTGIDWFVEGLAVLVSGQLASEHLGKAREALESGSGPTELARAWSGRYRYGVSGSLVAYVEHRLGRERMRTLLGATSGEELLGLIGLEEAELLEGWRAWALRPGAGGCD